MRRVQKYELLVGEVQSLTEKPDRSQLNEIEQFTSWHKVCNAAIALQEASEPAKDSVIVDASNGLVIASICGTNLQFETAQEADDLDEDSEDFAYSFPRWESSRIGKVGDREFYFSRNMTDFYWQMLEGAKREVPYRLNYIERKAERNPNTLFAYFVDIAIDLRDRIMATARL